MKLFQQFFAQVKALKRLSGQRVTIHRAEATVLMKLAEISHKTVSVKDFPLRRCCPMFGFRRQSAPRMIRVRYAKRVL